jgi:hypothetical protein
MVQPLGAREAGPIENLVEEFKRRRVDREGIRRCEFNAHDGFIELNWPIKIPVGLLFCLTIPGPRCICVASAPQQLAYRVRSLTASLPVQPIALFGLIARGATRAFCEDVTV